ncbi:hypothetical protein ACJWR2_28670 [Klebsiella pneumoniae]|uniref:hypothetical protein n=1 Tax=Klebsiella TaxID=570 RepID=UPI000B9A4CFB|nr:hypothetical protein [Klebsiella pneumoniae]UNC57981.1 hypothetical protein CVC44_27560 [Klebsiella pneumoniae subsp. pneumoniae]AUH82950.1 hypothetical protein CYD98_29525 [Klebsiella pneumoniae]AVJ63032.1 hypothetical protein B7D38_00970 [Klebsiella pneumoniae]AWA55956.1 hypothetical protein C6M51_05335 [Klebsiella pneumoniae]KAB1688516.1 hypothetical protein FNE66_29095 [Klebsiella pneumoniae]
MGSCAAPSAKGDDKFITTDYLQQCRITHHQAVSGIATLYTAATEGRREEALEYLREGRKLLRQ